MNLSKIFRVLKGSSNSGNFGHSGRKGKVGGSGPGFSLGGMNRKVLLENVDKISQTHKENALARFDANKPKTEVTREQLIAYLDRTALHRQYVAHNTFTVARSYFLNEPEKTELRNNLLKHDLDKYDWKVIEPYIGAFKIDRKIYQDVFNEAMNNHHRNNSHHYEYWVNDQGKAQKMPKVAFIEMIGDWVGTAEEKKTPIDQYYRRFRKDMNLHPDTRAQAELWLGVKK